MLNFITWDANPEIFHIGAFSVRWYGLLFALGFLLSHRVLSYIFRKEGKPETDVDELTVYMVIATVLGARLGHFLFYQPEVFWTNPLEIITPPFAGLASHGAAIGQFIALYLYVNYGIAFFHKGKVLSYWKRKKPGQTYLWMIDRMVIVVALAGCCIRFGNLMNSEIVGTETDVPWAFRFVRDTEHYPLVPRHPAQLYESIYCLILFFFLLWVWSKRKQYTREGLLSGLFMIILFTLRFLDEFLKESQEAFEDTLPLNMGQILSIPAVLFGIGLLIIAFRKKSTDASPGSVTT